MSVVSVMRKLRIRLFVGILCFVVIMSVTSYAGEDAIISVGAIDLGKIERGDINLFNQPILPMPCVDVIDHDYPRAFVPHLGLDLYLNPYNIPVNGAIFYTGANMTHWDSEYGYFAVSTSSLTGVKTMPTSEMLALDFLQYPFSYDEQMQEKYKRALGVNLVKDIARISVEFMYDEEAFGEQPEGAAFLINFYAPYMDLACGMYYKLPFGEHIVEVWVPADIHIVPGYRGFLVYDNYEDYWTSPVANAGVDITLLGSDTLLAENNQHYYYMGEIYPNTRRSLDPIALRYKKENWKKNTSVEEWEVHEGLSSILINDIMSGREVLEGGLDAYYNLGLKGTWYPTREEFFSLPEVSHDYYKESYIQNAIRTDKLKGEMLLFQKARGFTDFVLEPIVPTIKLKEDLYALAEELETMEMEIGGDYAPTPIPVPSKEPEESSQSEEKSEGAYKPSTSEKERGSEGWIAKDEPSKAGNEIGGGLLHQTDDETDDEAKTGSVLGGLIAFIIFILAGGFIVIFMKSKKKND